ncbi:MAG TPA: efflux RND transporter permease subunit [Acidobacteriaceae bacterium]|nr:efflux RND transporter permease subunit [Acidobacteriaceae bacterium]
MHISAPFIRRPIGTALLTIALMLAGIVAYNLLPVAPMPEVEFPTIGVQASLPGASPKVMASAVATPLEREFGRIAGVTQMTSVSTLGSSAVTLQFDLNRNIDAAARDVQAAINAARGQLPSNLPGNPTYNKFNPADAPIYILALTSDLMPKPKIYDYASSILAQKLAQINGVGQVYVGGSSNPAVRIEANPTVLSSYGIGLESVRTALGTVNVNMPKGSLNNKTTQMVVSDTDQLFGSAAYKPLIIAYSNGHPVRLQDIGNVVDSVENIYTWGLANDKPAVLVIIFKAPGANIIHTVDQVKKDMPQLAASLPPSIHLTTILDRTLTIRAAVDDVEMTLVISVLLVILVVFFFLRDPMATLIPSIAVPLSLLGTFGMMYLLGYTLDNLSLMALTISTGFVVDDAIVVIENISRYREEGYSAFDAAMRGSKEIGFTVISMSVSLVAVFIPILLMGGIVGRLFREFAVTLSLAICVSLIVSLTTTPMMSAYFLRDQHARKHGSIYRACEWIFDKSLSVYRHGLHWVLDHQPLMLVVTLLTFVINVYLFIYIPKGFFPQQDTGRIMGQILADQDVSFDAMRIKQEQFTSIVMKDPGVSSVICFIGGNGNTMNTGRMFVTLKTGKDRVGSADDIINRLRPKLMTIPGASLFMQASQDVSVGGRMSAAQYQYTLEDQSLSELLTWAPKLKALFQKMPELRDVSTDLQDQGLETELVIDRATASRLGISTQMIDNTLYDAFGQRQVSTIYTPLNQYHVVLEVAPQFQRDPEALRNIYVKATPTASTTLTGSAAQAATTTQAAAQATTASSAQVPLSAIAHYERKRTSLQVNHQGQFPAVTLTFNLAPGVALGQAVDAIERVQQEAHMPASIYAGFQGTAQAFQTSLANEPYLILAALLAVYVVLGILYESYIHPITILSTLPSAGIGAILALLLFHIEFSVIALIGMILLIGLVKKNAILMIDFALEAERNRGRTPEEAIYEACVLRFRPIMMTTLAALFGGLPLAVSHGTGSELRRPLGIAIVGGLIVSQVLTLYTTPVVYLFWDKLQIRFAHLRGKGHDTAGSHLPANGD